MHHAATSNTTRQQCQQQNDQGTHQWRNISKPNTDTTTAQNRRTGPHTILGAFQDFQLRFVNRLHCMLMTSVDDLSKRNDLTTRPTIRMTGRGDNTTQLHSHAFILYMTCITHCTQHTLLLHLHNVKYLSNKTIHFTFVTSSSFTFVASGRIDGVTSRSLVQQHHHWYTVILKF